MTGLEQAILWTAVGMVAWAVLAPSGAPVPVPRPTLPAAPMPPPGELACPPAGLSVALIGDSLAVGLGPPMARMAQACGTSFSVNAKVGTSVVQWVQDSWLQPVLDHNPSIVLVSLGANDFGRNDRDNVAASIRTLVGKVRAAKARLIWIEPLTMPFPDKIGVVEAWKAVVGDDWYPSYDLYIPRSPDHIHPTGAGYATFADKVWHFMANKVQV